MRALSVALQEKLRKTKSGLERRSAVAQGALQGLPQSDVIVRERDHLGPHHAFAGCLPVAKV